MSQDFGMEVYSVYIIIAIILAGGIFLYSREQQSQKIKQELQKELEMTGEEKPHFQYS